MNKIRFKTITVGILVLTVLVGLVLAGHGRDGRGQRSGREFGPERFGRMSMGAGRHGEPAGLGGPAVLRILGRLNLTDEQKESIKKIAEEAKEKGKAAAEAVGESRKALSEAVDQGDESAVHNAAMSLGKVLGEQAVLKIKTMVSIKKVLTPEQLQRLEELKEKMKERSDESLERMDAPRFRRGFRELERRRYSRGHSDERRGFGPRGRSYDEGPWRRSGRFHDGPEEDWGW